MVAESQQLTDQEPVELLTEEERNRPAEFGSLLGPKWPDPREVAEQRASVRGLLLYLDHRCPSCGDPGAHPTEDSAFHAVCTECGCRMTKYVLAQAVLHDPTAFERMIENYDGLLEHLAVEGRMPL